MHRRIDSNTDRSAQRAAAVRPEGVDCDLSQFRAARQCCSSDTRHGIKYRGADKTLARPGRKQLTATEDFEFRISYYPIYNHNWRNISTIYIYIVLILYILFIIIIAGILVIYM
jgi:hypothetical protein